MIVDHYIIIKQTSSLDKSLTWVENNRPTNKTNSTSSTEKNRKYRNRQAPSKNVPYASTDIVDKGMKPPDLTKFKNKMIQSLKDKQANR